MPNRAGDSDIGQHENGDGQKRCGGLKVDHHAENGQAEHQCDQTVQRGLDDRIEHGLNLIERGDDFAGMLGDMKPVRLAQNAAIHRHADLRAERVDEACARDQQQDPYAAGQNDQADEQQRHRRDDGLRIAPSQPLEQRLQGGELEGRRRIGQERNERNHGAKGQHLGRGTDQHQGHQGQELPPFCARHVVEETSEQTRDRLARTWMSAKLGVPTLIGLRILVPAFFRIVREQAAVS